MSKSGGDIVRKVLREQPARGVKRKREAIEPIVPEEVEDMITGRPDEELLREHLKAIDAHSQTYKQRKLEAEDKQKNGDASEVHAIPAHKAKITEAIGEYQATLLMIAKYPDYEIEWTFSAGIGIDQLWHRGKEGEDNETFMVVEAKGPGATLSTEAAKGDQMSIQWVRASLTQVVNSGKASDEERRQARRMLGAMDNGPPPELRGVVITADKNGGAHEMDCPDKGIYHST